MAQNLVLNPSFEEHSPCRDGSEQLDSVKHWQNIAGTPRWMDLACPLSSENSVYVKAMKLPPAYTGNSYVGLGLDFEGEYIQGQLSQALEAGKVYRLSLRLRLPLGFCNRGLQYLGMAFQQHPWPQTEEYQSLAAAQMVGLQNVHQKNFSQQYDWEYLEGFYTAKGGETHLGLGNFKGLNEQLLSQRKKGECTYVYLDHISVEEFKEQPLPAFAKESVLRSQDRYRLPYKAEENGQWTCTAPALLEHLLDLAKANPKLKFEVLVHEYHYPTEQENLHFSQQQAQKIQQEWEAKGLKNSQFQCIGRGSSQPIAPQSEQNNRDKNQRIELVVE
jgi:hypothetical protein